MAYCCNSINNSLAYALFYIVTLMIGTFITAIIYPSTFIDALFENASALGNVGLSTGITSITMPVTLKILFIVEMFLGRLEFFTIIIAIIVVFERIHSIRR